jgi:glycosyltransferase involved in cell wall biosynthesis
LLTKPFHRRKIVFSRRVNFQPKGFFTKIKYLNTDKIIAVSIAVKNTIRQFCKRKDSEVISDVALPKISDSSSAQKILKELAVPDSKFVIGTIAALDEHKAPMITINAIRQLKKLREDFVVLHFGDGPLYDICLEKIKEYHLEQHYFLVGFKESVEDYFSLFNVFVLTSIAEGLGSSILDAFLYKVPVVATNAGGIKELLENGRGTSCNINDVQAIANGINELLNKDEETISRQIESAYSYVVQEHSISAISSKYLSVFHELISKK